MDLKTIVACISDTISWMSEDLDDEVSSVLQLISRNGCHKFNHGKVASPLFPTFCWSCWMFCIFDHGPQTGAIRMTSGACSLMISMTTCRPLDVITSNPVRMSTGVPTLRPDSAQH